MKNVKTMYRKLTMMVVLGVLLAVMSCNNLLTPPKGNSTDRDSGSGNVSEDGKVLITIKLFTGSARMVMPDIEQLDWHITAKQGTDNIEATGTYPTYTLELPTTGNWTFTVKGTKENKELFTGTATENVSNSTTSISIPLSPGSGMTEGSGATGNLDLTIKPEDVLTMTLKYRVDGGDWCTCITSSGLDPDQGEYWTPYYITESNLSVGQYTLDLYFGGGSKFYFCTVAVNIWPGMTSDQWIKTNGEEYINDNGEFVITEEMVNKFVKTMGSVVFVDASVDANTPATGSIFAPVKTVSKAVDILRKANPGGNYSGTIMVSGATTITNEVQVQSGESLTVKGRGTGASITNDKGRVFNITGGSVTLGDGITLTGTVTGENARGGAVYVTGGNFTMESGSTIADSSVQGTSASGGGVYVMNGTFIMEDGSKITGSSATVSGGGVAVSTDGTFTMRGGTIDGTGASSNAESGGGVEIHDAIFTMEGGTITGNNATYGGGVRVDSGEFIMKDGTISDNNATNLGGGVCVINGSFTMSGNAAISNNEAYSSGSSGSYGGGVYVNGGNFEMIGGTIGGPDAGSANTATYGGGVYVNGGEFEMTGTAILQGNTATTHGGGVHILSGGTFTMNGGTIGGTAKNTATYGGGVFISGGIFNMNDGTISGNTVTQSGGGVYVNDGNFTMAGGTIGGTTANTATQNGGGVFIFNGTFAVSGSSLTITGNTANNVYLASGKTITIGADGLTGGTIWVTAENVPSGSAVQITNGDVNGAAGIFTSDMSDRAVHSINGNVYMIDTTPGNAPEVAYVDTNGTTNFDTFAQAFAVQATTITLLQDITPTTAPSFNLWPIPFDWTCTLDLNGYTINRELTSALADGSVIKIVGGTLTIKDSSATNPDGTGGTGKITGGNDNGRGTNTGGGICIENNSSSSLTLESGNISGNVSDGLGGGVHIGAGCSFTMKGGKIDSNKVTASSGGGVAVNFSGTFIMSGGIITGNTTTNNGGGVNIGSNGAFTMSGGTISGNTATQNGGGVYVGNGTFTLSGSPNISRNGLDGLNNVYLTSGKTISIGAGGLNTSARIGVTTATSPAAGTEVRITDTAVDGAESIFIPDAEGCIIMSKEDAVYLADSSSFEVSWDTGSGVQYGSFADGISALNTSGSGGTITLQKNIDGTNAVFSSDGGTTANDQPITFSGGAEASPVILDLNGCTIDRGLGTAQADGTVISVSGALTLKDSTGSGKITGGNNNNSTTSGTWGGGVCVQDGAFFTMEGGNISYNFSGIGGGGVYVCNGGSFTMTGGTIGGSDVNDGNMNTSTSYGGGGVFVNGEFTMSGGTITGNITDANGGGVAVTADGTFTMSGTAVISDNEASGGSGGGVYSAADFTMTGGTISSNTATDGGGVYMINSKKITMDGGAISGNTATTNGGGLYLYDGSTAEIGKNTSGSAPQISNNVATNDGTADNAGGGIYLAASSSVEFTRGTIRSNTVGEGTGFTSSQGGGVYIGSGSTFIMDGESAIIENNKINSVIGAGGGIYSEGGTLEMKNGSITGNNAGNSGGGVYVSSATFTMTDGEISGNSASFGGGVTVGDAGTFIISSPAVVSGNTISSVGGANVHVNVSTGGKFIDDDNCVTEGVEEQ